MNPLIIILSIVFTIALLLVVGTAMTPFRILKRLGINIVIGLFLLLTINYFGNEFGFKVPVNEFTTLLVGVLGVPGFIVILVLKTLV
ncbi:MAG: hypothetical protein K0R71_2156 [Bacillales bacterium]|nr:hypothetical protein [Bacillales bacterium]